MTLVFTANFEGLGTLPVRVCDRSREVEVGFELGLVGLTLGIAGPKNKVAELVNLLIGALTDTCVLQSKSTSTSKSTSLTGTTVCETVRACSCACWCLLLTPITLRLRSGEPASELSPNERECCEGDGEEREDLDGEAG